ncbi:MAG: glycosyl hydrolase family 17 protein [Myxococcota bacterium]
MYEPQSESALIAGKAIALAYSGFRQGQHPDRGQGEVMPSVAEIEEDLRLLSEHGVDLIRLYDSGKLSERVLQTIETKSLPIKVVLGAWLRAEVSAHETCAWLNAPIPASTLEANREENKRELERAISFANRYRTAIVAVNVGNEALVTWNDHLVSIEAMVEYIGLVKSRIAQPVTTADNYLAWVEHGKRLMTVADFAFVHTYPVWEGKSLTESMDYTRANLVMVRQALPTTAIAIGEAGWPSIASEFGERASEENQAEYVSQLIAFAKASNTTVFVFEAFDEDWKGNDDPNGAEKHWGLFNIDRTAKKGVQSGKLLPRR